MAGGNRYIDMTQGSILKNVFRFAIPICLGNLLQQLYGTVDAMVIGNFCPASSLAAVGTSDKPVEILLCIFLGIGTGVSILVSQCVGSGNRDKIVALTATAVSFLYLCALPLTLAGPFLGAMVLRLMQVPPDTWQAANDYVSIVFLGTLGNMGYNMNAGILRGMGDSRASLIFLMISCAVNIALDLLFVGGMGMDVSGAALATAIAMMASWLFSIAYIHRHYPELSLTLLPHRLDKRILRDIIRIGLPLGLNASIYSIGHVFLQVFINVQGSVFMAACTVGGKVQSLANMAIASISSAATMFAGQNFGAGRYRNLRRGAWIIPVASALICMAGTALVLCLADEIVTLFTRDPRVIRPAIVYSVYVILPFSWAFAAFNCIVSIVNGMGLVRYTTFVNVLMLWGVRIPASYLISRCLDGNYVLVGVPLSFVFGLVCMLAYFFTRQWREICRLARQEAGKEKTAGL